MRVFLASIPLDGKKLLVVGSGEQAIAKVRLASHTPAELLWFAPEGAPAEADRHGLTLVENDLYLDLDPDPRPSLASLDQLARVVHVGSYSKTISPNLRVGFVAAHPALIDDLAQLKMISGLTSSAFSEQLVLGALTEGRWRKHLKSLRGRLAAAHEHCGALLAGLGFELFAEPKAGMFLWARHPAVPDPVALSNRAAQHDIMLGPGHLFSATLQPGDWMRFNVAFAGDPRLEAFLAEQLGSA